MEDGRGVGAGERERENSIIFTKTFGSVNRKCISQFTYVLKRVNIMECNSISVKISPMIKNDKNH